jgi:pyruvate dehydrogenase E1 component alpha subunit
VEGWRRRDPIQRLEEALQASGWASADELERIRLEVKAELEAAIAFARAGDPVQPDDFWNYVSGDESNA